jgi:hypothetical protein
MSDKTKLILKIIGFVIIIILIAWGLWAMFFKSPGASYIPGRSIPISTGQLPDILEGQGGTIIDISQQVPTTLVPEPETLAIAPDVVATGGRTIVNSITPSRADHYSQSKNGMLNYYDARTEKFYRISPKGGSPTLLSDEVFRNVQQVTWANSSDSAILEFPDGSNIYYNFENGNKATLPTEAREFSFSPKDDSLAYEYIGENKDDRWIITSNTDGQGQQLVQPIGTESLNVKVDWSPNNQVLATFREPTSSLGEEVFFIGFNNENFVSLQTNGIGFEGKWSTKGKQILYSVYSESSNYNPILYISGAEGDGIGLGNRSLRIQTWPDKCAFESEEYIYCAVPQFLNQGSGIFREQTIGTADTIYRIDLVNNVSEPIAFPETQSRSSFTIENMQVSEDGTELYFTDRVTGRIHVMQLR